MKLKHVSRGIRGTLAVCGLIATGILPTGAKASCGPGDSVYLGSVCTTAISYCPRGYEPLAGQMKTIESNSALFSLLGCQWGGDCRTTFAFPDLRGRVPMGAGQGPGLTPRSLGQWAGTETHVLSLDELASHHHEAKAVAGGEASVEFTAFDGLGASVTPTAANKFLQTVAANPLSPSTNARIYGTGTGTPVALGGVDFSGSLGSVTVDPTGLSKPFSVLNPMTVLTYCIATEGIYPPRT